ncbi:MAG: hypothetical protein GX595_18050, partial [Lentisphaerae bacterium]|nr:hypothetical protein [Lentisphaerota bacterium]
MPVAMQPLAWIGLAALPALLAVYILHRRLRRREVSAVFLWQGLDRQAAGRQRWRWRRPPASFWVEAALLLLLTLAAVGLCWPAQGRSRPLVVVADDSFSMLAVSGGVSARARAEAALRREVSRLQPTSVRLGLAG